MAVEACKTPSDLEKRVGECYIYITGSGIGEVILAQFKMCFQQAKCSRSFAVQPAFSSRTFRLIHFKTNLTGRIGKTTKINLNNYWREFEALLVPDQQTSNTEEEDDNGSNSQL